MVGCTQRNFVDWVIERDKRENASASINQCLHKVWSEFLTEIWFFFRLVSEHDFICYTASNVAASSIAAALNGLKWHLRSGMDIGHLFNLLTDLTGVEQVSESPI
jgi:hypothetical protein